MAKVNVNVENNEKRGLRTGDVLIVRSRQSGVIYARMIANHHGKYYAFNMVQGKFVGSGHSTPEELKDKYEKGYELVKVIPGEKAVIDISEKGDE